MKIVVGQGSCGIAAGAGRVYDALAQALSGTAHELTIAGCIGMCYLEPIVDIYEESGALTRLVLRAAKGCSYHCKGGGNRRSKRLGRAYDHG